MLKLTTLCILAGAALVAVAAAAEQGLPAIPPGKTGLYELRKTSNLAMFIARDLSKTPVEEQQKMSAEAMTHPGPVFQLCVPKDGAKVFNAAVGMTPACAAANIVKTEHGFSADLRCGPSTIHVTVDAATPEHREFTAASQSMPHAAIPLIDKYEINWIAADCGALPVGSMRLPDGKVIALKP